MEDQLNNTVPTTEQQNETVHTSMRNQDEENMNFKKRGKEKEYN